MKPLFVTSAILLAALLSNGCAVSGSTASTHPSASPVAGLDRQSPADSASAYKDSPGFFSADAPQIPRQVKAAEKSVFQIRVLMATSQEATRQYDVTDGKALELKKRYAALPDSELDKFEKIIVIKEIERCERYTNISEQKTCAITTQMARGTAFLAGNDTTLWTNFHNVDHYLDLVEKFGGISKADQIKKHLKLAVYVFDSTRHLVLDPAVVDVRLSVIPKLTSLAAAERNLFAEDSDYVALTVGRSLGTPLKLAHRRPATGETLYHIGYPYCTGCSTAGILTDTPEDFADRAPYPNSDGHHLYASIGVSVDSSTAKSFLGISDTLAASYNLDRILFSSADGVGGNSGSPILDKNGLVLGIASGGKTLTKQDRYERLTRGVLPTEFL